jgi:exopolysaccharide biosynthesis polyprenyl glycosylphosphotransferase
MFDMAVDNQAPRTSSTATMGTEASRLHWRNRWRRRFMLAAAGGDALVGATAAAIALDITPHPDSWGFFFLPVLLGVAWVAWLRAGRTYDWNLFGEGVEEYRRVAVAGLVAVGLVAVVSAIAQVPNGRGLVIGLLAATALSLVWRRCVRGLLHRRRRTGLGMNRAVLVGPTSAVEATAHLLSRASFHGTKVVGALVPPGDRLPDRRLVPAYQEGLDVPTAADAFAADEVILLRSVDLESLEMRDLMWALADRDVNLLIKPMSLHVAGPRLSVRPVDGLPLLQIARPQISGLARTVKGAIDRSMASLGLLLLAPLLLSIAVVVVLQDRGPVFYKQVRIGEGGRPFAMYKFRSMHVDADQRLHEVQELNVHPDGVHIAIVNDPRVTWIGRYLRRYSLDELPQLINVVKGEMALVGPRPPLPNEVEAYPDHGWFRMAVRPGLTGLWQIKGPERHFLSLDEALELDLRYVENWSLSYDWAILWKTVAVVLRGSGEVKTQPESHRRSAQVMPPVPRALPDNS